MTEQTPTVKTQRCECGHWWIGTVVDVERGEVQDEHNTGCAATTTKLFAQGHDAKLKSLLIQAGTLGVEVHDGRGSSSDALVAARRLGWADQVCRGIDRATAKAQARTQRAAKATERQAAAPRKVAAKVAPGSQTGDTPRPRNANLKVGRWTYQGQINPDGTAVYTDRAGRSHTLKTGQYTEIEQIKRCACGDPAAPGSDNCPIHELMTPGLTSAIEQIRAAQATK